jgi:SAM-dependent methyltransferase
MAAPIALWGCLACHPSPGSQAVGARPAEPTSARRSPPAADVGSPVVEGGAPSHPSGHDASPPPPAADPGLNARFRSTDLEVAPWVQRFESEEREIFVKRDEIVSFVDPKAGMAIADLGAGTGLFTGLFSRAVGRDGRVYAVDIAPRFLRHIEDRARERRLTNVKTVLATDASTQLAPASVDVVFMCDTYHHLERPAEVMASVHRALKPQGVLVVVEFRRDAQAAAWVHEHVRAGEATFTAEIEAAGFTRSRRGDFLKTNYVLAFTKR